MRSNESCLTAADHNDLEKSPIAPASLPAVPVIDLRQPRLTLVSAIDEACRTFGFFNLTGHGFDPDLVRNVLETTADYFDLPASAKRRQLRTRENPWGYYDRELTKEQRDRKEVFDIGPDIAPSATMDGDPFQGTTPWPAQLPDLRRLMHLWFEQSAALSGAIIGLVAEALGDDRKEISRAFDGHTSFLRLNHYPVADPLGGSGEDDADLGIHHHTDAGAITLLLQDGISGLQVFNGGYWHNVEREPGSITVNIGDMVQIWSNDLYAAPVHRVLAMTTVRRLSLAYFHNPAYDAVIRPLDSPARYRPLIWGDFRARRADGDYQKGGTEVQISEWAI